MLQKIHIRNYAIIDELTITFDNHLNVITGETGAGKSIILGALSLILGDRVDTSVLINRDEKCYVEAYFDTRYNHAFNRLLAINDIDEEKQTIIRREINASGKSRAFVNDTPVTLGTLNELTSCLVDIHRQFDNRAIEDESFAYKVLDAMAKNQGLIQKYEDKFKAYRALQSEYNTLFENQHQWQKEADYNQFLFEELQQINLKENEIEDAEIVLKQLNSSETIKAALGFTYAALEEGEFPINIELKKVMQQLQSITNLFPESEELANRLESSYHELRDIANEANRLIDKVEIDTEQLVLLQEKVDAGYRLFKKHGVHTTNELIEIYHQLEESLKSKNNAEEKLQFLAEDIAFAEKELFAIAAEISTKRQETAPSFGEKISNMLTLIGMPNAILQVSVTPTEKLNEFGTDKVQLLFDANKSGKFVPVHKAASGGETSRIMLCIKTMTAEAMELPTLIFDEVDTGISGEAAKQVGFLLKHLSDYHQVLCITHQPQVASKGTQHLYVYKTHNEEKVKTRVRILDDVERINLIAQMIAGEPPSLTALNNAKELLEDQQQQ